jgi:hypothetical protein
VRIKCTESGRFRLWNSEFESESDSDFKITNITCLRQQPVGALAGAAAPMLELVSIQSMIHHAGGEMGCGPVMTYFCLNINDCGVSTKMLYLYTPSTYYF